jgi:cysteinyl-tRNA synthetase
VPAGLLSEPGDGLRKAVREHRRRFFAAMDDDFNSAGAIGALFGLVKDVNQYAAAAGETLRDAEPLNEAWSLMSEGVTVLGLHPGGIEGLTAVETVVPPEILALAARRDAARAAKDWAAADALRDEIQAHGFVMEDGAGGTIVRPAG